MNIAIIIACGGNKEIYEKNIMEFCGKPIIAYSIEAALSSGCFDEIMVSTDNGEVAEIARKYGAKVPFMCRSVIPNNYIDTVDILSEVLSEYKKSGKDFDIMACIYSTAPFVTGKKLNDALKIMNEKEADGIIPVVRFSFPPQRCFVSKNSILSYKYPEYKTSRSQDLEPYFYDCRQFYILRVSEFLKNKHIITDNVYPFVVLETESQDINSETDWKLAEIKYSFMLKNAR